MRASMRRARRARGRDERRSFGRCVVRYVWGGEVYGVDVSGEEWEWEGRRKRDIHPNQRSSLGRR